MRNDRPCPRPVSRAGLDHQDVRPLWASLPRPRHTSGPPAPLVQHRLPDGRRPRQSRDPRPDAACATAGPGDAGAAKCSDALTAHAKRKLAESGHRTRTMTSMHLITFRDFTHLMGLTRKLADRDA